ncbi:hypothetical protein [Streptomyces aidingensis]|uniref:Uncharacterized protein n=1 Tax=Streptomyces aidingensis TaxID=910347 RepID=A0A1I1PXK3_9ACTN|nr:hypothetical protein [Streptomyces aidingensis]SFD14651.1 hypothetical protein SAMN05421773_110133 [Streptomyces aidingensis]
MTTWNKLTKDDQQHARDLLDSLRDYGVHTSLSQVAANLNRASQWAAGRLRLATLCQRAGWDTTTIAPTYQTTGDTRMVHLPTTAFRAALDAAKEAPTDTPGDHGTHYTAAVRLKDGRLVEKNYAIVQVRTTRGTTRQILTGRRRELGDTDPGMTWAEPAPNTHHPQRGLACAECGTYGASILRRDSLDRVAFVCPDCEADAHFTERPFASL